MSQQTESNCRGFSASTAIAQYRRVKLSSGELVVCAATDQGVGSTEVAALAAGELVSVRLWSATGTRKMVASAAIAAGAEVFGAASGGISATATTAYVGVALEAATAAGDIIEVAVNPHYRPTA